MGNSVNRLQDYKEVSQDDNLPIYMRKSIEERNIKIKQISFKKEPTHPYASNTKYIFTIRFRIYYLNRKLNDIEFYKMFHEDIDKWSTDIFGFIVESLEDKIDNYKENEYTGPKSLENLYECIVDKFIIPYCISVEKLKTLVWDKLYEPQVIYIGYYDAQFRRRS